MSFQIDAIYDGGVLKPLEPLALPDQSRVRLTVAAEQDADDSAEVLAAQQRALDELRKTIDALPQVRNNDGWSVRRHDELLYGKP